GFGMAALLVLLMKRYTRNPALLVPPEPGAVPPPGTRALLIATCGGVSLAHGSNDGQKGVGLVMLILMGLLPTQYALDLGSRDAVQRTVAASVALEEVVREHADLDALPRAEKVT